MIMFYRDLALLLFRVLLLLFCCKIKILHLLKMVSTHYYKPYSHVPHYRVGFLRCFGSKTGIHFAHFSFESGMIFDRVYEYSYPFNSK